ncbi:MAG: hypothetical protein FJ167_13520 [Gammaproteobacteria bacterium]|nr:hypothetical protein [Gammaproteobacteria bacterium]
MNDIDVYASADPLTNESVTLPLTDWFLIADICAYARGHFTSNDSDPEVEASFLRALDRIDQAIKHVTPHTPFPASPSRLTH